MFETILKYFPVVSNFGEHAIQGYVGKDTIGYADASAPCTINKRDETNKHEKNLMQTATFGESN